MLLNYEICLVIVPSSRSEHSSFLCLVLLNSNCFINLVATFITNHVGMQKMLFNDEICLVIVPSTVSEHSSFLVLLHCYCFIDIGYRITHVVWHHRSLVKYRGLRHCLIHLRHRITHIVIHHWSSINKNCSFHLVLSIICIAWHYISIDKHWVLLRNHCFINLVATFITDYIGM